VRVEAADGQPSAMHHVRDPRPGDALLTEQTRGGGQDRLVRALFLFLLGVHGVPAFQAQIMIILHQ
jgi:hypothetical protein